MSYTYLVKDCTQNAATFNITVNRNGNNIDGAASNDTISTNAQAVSYTYVDVTTGYMRN